MKKKILFFIHDLSYGGAEKVLVNLVNNMDFNKFDITVQTIFDVGIHKEKFNDNVKYHPGFKYMFRGNSHLFKLFSPKCLSRFFVREDYDIVVSYLEGTPARIISGYSQKNVKKVCWLHTQIDDQKKYRMGFRSIKEANECYGKFDKLICVSETVKESFISTVKEIDTPIEILYNTNETKDIIRMSQEEVKDVIFEKDCINICSVAKITKNKGFDRLAHVHKKLIEEGLKHHIYILGVGKQRKEIEIFLKKNGLMQSFTFLGFKDNPYKYVAQCDLYVCSSFKEGLSTAVTESLIVGTPVVSTLCSGAKELLGYHNEYGLVVDNTEDGIYKGIKYMLTHKDEMLRYRALAKQRGLQFSKEKTVKAVEKMFLDLTEGIIYE